MLVQVVERFKGNGMEWVDWACALRDGRMVGRDGQWGRISDQPVVKHSTSSKVAFAGTEISKTENNF